MDDRRSLQDEIDRNEIKPVIDAMVRAYSAWKTMMVRSAGNAEALGFRRTPALAKMHNDQKRPDFIKSYKRYEKYVKNHWPEDLAQ